jgi:hypothetical protein
MVKTIAATHILAIYLVIFVHMVLPVYLYAAPNLHENPDLPGRTRLRRLWFIHTHENGFDQGIKKM